LRPDPLSIPIGINDSTRHVPLDEFETTYGQLLAAAVTGKPKASRQGERLSKHETKTSTHWYGP
jgi:hypothetical protein